MKQPDGFPPEAAFLPNFGLEERTLLLELARESLESLIAEQVPTDLDGIPACLKLKRACFVTLTNAGELRGCIGQVFPKHPLFEAVRENCRKAALSDPRFAPIAGSEVNEVRIEISVLTLPQPVQFSSPEDLLAKLVAFEEGVVLQIGDSVTTFLPQVWAQVPEKTEFLGRLSQKAGYPPDAWREKGVQVSTYRTESFGEK